MVNFVGRSDDLLLFTEGNKAVIIDASYSLVVASGHEKALTASGTWADGEFSETDEELAARSLTSMDIAVPETTGRLYTIPRAVQEEAEQSVAWNKVYGAKTSPVGKLNGSILAAGGQISFEKIRQLDRYFSQHTAVSSELGATGMPSADRISWGLRGGEAARKWASTIVGRESVTADATAPTESGIDPFEDAFQLDDATGPEFLARVRKDGSGIDRLYKIDLDRSVYIWDDGSWDNLGTLDGDIWTYDKTLDDIYDTVEKDHIVIDPDSAIVIASRLQNNPGQNVLIEDIDEEEARMAVDAIEGIDWEMVDFSITAAGESDGIYSPEERSKNATNQVRDKTGKFAMVGTRVIIGGDARTSGKITKINPEDMTVTVVLDNGVSVDVPGNIVEEASTAVATLPGESEPLPEVDTTGILAEPRQPLNSPLARIPGTLPSITREDLHNLITSWPAWVKSQREKFVGGGGEQTPVQPRTDDDPYQHPLLTNWLSSRKRRERENSTVWTDPIRAAADPSTEGEELTPEKSDVEPIYLAVVSPDDPQAVLQLVSLVPATSASTTPMTYTRQNRVWERNPQVLSNLNSATPPPVVPLDAETLQTVLTQVDSVDNPEVVDPNAPVQAPLPQSAPTPVTADALSLDTALSVLYGPSSLIAAGGADRNNGGAEKLRRYWTRGPGAAKIRWGTPGDWTRCVRYLSKYMGQRSKGYCALRHKEMTGMWTGDKEHRQMFGIREGEKVFSDEIVTSTEELLRKATQKARALEMGLTAAGEAPAAMPVVPIEDTQEAVEAVNPGASFTIPLVIPEEIETGDGRIFSANSIDIRDLPLPLLWQVQTGEGHDGSYVVGRIDSMERIEGGIGNATGFFDTGVYGKEAERLVRERFLKGVSADMDKFEARQEEVLSEEDPEEVKNVKLVVDKARVMGVTIVAKPAFQECQIYLEGQEPAPVETPLADGEYVDEIDDPIAAAALLASAEIAHAIPVTPPVEWFENPKFREPTPITVSDDGKVFGHIAAWHVDHIAYSNQSLKPPRSRSGYRYFNKGVLRTDVGKDVTVGQLTLTGGHAPLHATAAAAARHYDDTQSAIADVHAGEDRYGIWVSGSLRPGVTPEQVRVFRASTPSGDWRPIEGSLELVAVCQVNVPGFPVARALVASGELQALVAAGAAPIAKLRHDPVSELSSRIETLEQFTRAELSTRAAEAKKRVDVVRDAKRAALAANAETLSLRVMSSIDTFSADSATRKKLAGEGKALPDGSFPIATADDLQKAIQAFGRSKKSDREKVRKHIIKRARALGKSDLIPEKWKSAASDSSAERVLSMRETVLAAKKKLPPVPGGVAPKATTPVPEAPVPGEEVPQDPAYPKYTPDTQPRDGDGKFRLILARLRDNLGREGNQEVLDKLQETENLDSTGDYVEASKSAVDLIDRIDKMDSGALSKDAIRNIREVSRDLGKVVANLPLPDQNQSQKIRFSDVPPAMRDLIDNIIERVEDRLSPEEAAKVTKGMKDFKSGSDVMNQAEISSHMNTLLRLLT